MKLLASFRVAGTPQQQGSKSPQGWETNKKLKPWRLTVSQVAAEAYTDAPYNEAVKIVATFQYAWRQGDKTKDGTLRALVSRFKKTAPDLDKLQRALGDALTGIVIVDDRLIAEWHTQKVYDVQDGVKVDVYAL